MLTDFYISRLSNDMKIAVQKNHLGAKCWSEVWTILKKRRIYFFFENFNRNNLDCLYRLSQQPKLFKYEKTKSEKFRITPQKLSPNSPPFVK